MRRIETVWVDPSFKKKLKASAALKGLTVTEYTKTLANDSIDLEKQFEDIKKSTRDERRFQFRF